MSVEPITVESVTLDKTELTLTRLETATLTATVLPADAADKTVAWSSDKPQIATVDEGGVVTAVAAGSATITATAGGMMATCEVTVEPIDVESIALDKTELTLKREETATITATVTPDNADENIAAWSSDKPQIATVDDNGVVTGVKPGTATITATAGGRSVACAVTVEPDVYVVGHPWGVGYYRDLFWKNGVMTRIPMETTISVFVYEGDVYIGGRYKKDNGRYATGIWKNGTIMEMDEGEYTSQYVFVSDGNVYVTGTLGGNTAYLWENGVRTRLDDLGVLCTTTSLYVSGEDVYVGGNRQLSTPNSRAATYWKNGTATDLTDGAFFSSVRSIVVANGVVYAAGDETTADGKKAVLWIDDIPTYLPEMYIAYNVLVSESGDVYVAGEGTDSSAVLWKNGQLIKLDSNGAAKGVFVYGNDVYVVGHYNRRASLWKNGVRTELPYGNSAYSISVFVY